MLLDELEPQAAPQPFEELGSEICCCCGEPVRHSLRGLLAHDRSQTVFCGPRSAEPLPAPCTIARTAGPSPPVALTTYLPRRHRAVRGLSQAER
ncbi:MAG: hypothetical protein ACRDL8_21405 [Solirubrobacteraceae bacterium]